MGIVGTDVAKEAADVILTDDNFATIVSAVEEGRRIYDNILKVIQFLLSSNVGEVIVLFLATLLTPMFAKWFGITDVAKLEILLPIHILWINLVTDSLPALALAFDPASQDIMKRKPAKPGKGVFTKRNDMESSISRNNDRPTYINSIHGRIRKYNTSNKWIVIR